MTMKLSDTPTLGDIQRKYNRAGVKDVEGLREDTEEYLDKTVNVDCKTVSLLAGVWSMVGENLERDAWKLYTREQWAELERQHVEFASFTVPDLLDNVLSRLERGRITQEEAHEELGSAKICDYEFCLNVFKPRRANQRFCCRNCKERQKEAVKRFERTNTFLPEYVYKENRDHTDEQNYRRREKAFNTDAITSVLEPFERNRENGYKRDRKREKFTGYTPRKGESSHVCTEENNSSRIPDFLEGSAVFNGGVSVRAGCAEASL